MIPSDPPPLDPAPDEPGGALVPAATVAPVEADPDDHESAAAEPAVPMPSGRAGAGTFTIEGRQAPALFVVGWLATLVAIGTIAIALLSGGGGAAPFLLIGGLALLSIGLVAGAGSQAIERRARGGATYLGPSPVLVFAASIPISLLAVVILGVPLSMIGVPVDGPAGRLASVSVQALIYVGLIRLLVVDAGALSWPAMRVHWPDGRTIRELASGAVWAAPVILVTIPIAAFFQAIFHVTPESPLPPTGEWSGLVINLIAGAVVAPIGEELLFRGFATTAWAADLGLRRAVIQGALFFAVVHVIGISGASAGDAFGLAVIGFASRVPVALALGWLFLRRGSIWVPIGLHATFNAILLILGEAAVRNGI